ncbi:MAG: ATP synthase F1 subunit delta [Clostridia bacterium]|nr:ATP synthase F1 subunit delta [Clostridia bacterium]MBO4429091.1 ATP synthase F1 subunit delta [Clostridia bacterium]
MNDVSREYGGALFELADGENISKEILDEIRAVAPFFERGSDYVRLLTTPNISAPERVKCVRDAFGGKVNGYLVNFISLMTERGRAYDVADSFVEYERRYNEKNGICTVKVKSAVPLSDSQMDALKAKLSKHFKKTVELSCEVDPSLIGGLTVCADGELIDGSVSAKISEIRKKLAEASIT